MIRRHTFAPADNRRLSHLCGPLDGHLREVEAALGVTLTRRDATLRIEGPREAVERTVALLDGLYAQADRPLGERTLQLALKSAQSAATPPPGAAASSGAAAAAADDAPPVLHTRHADLCGRTPNQVRYLRQMLSHDITFGTGPAGTGKTYLAVACAVDALERHGVQRIVLTRPAVEAGERLGFLPGDLAQKVDPYLRPLYDALYDLMGFDRVAKAFDKGLIEIAPLAFMRGRTLANALILLDEAQNASSMQMKMFLTRLGEGSRMIITGDPTQIDLPPGQVSGFAEAIALLKDVEGIGHVKFGHQHVVRHDLVRRIVQAYEERAADLPPQPRRG